MTIKNVKPVNKCILIVSDSVDEINDIQHLLVADVGSCLETDNELEGLRLFNENHPSVLVFAFQTTEKAEHFYLSLYRHNDQMHSVPHQTLLLCKSNESSKAYQLCKSGTFDDYVADRPLYDPYRLRLSVVQALNRRSQERYSYLLDDQIEKITGRLHEFDHFISDKLKSGGGQHQEAIHTFQQFTQNLATGLKQLEENLIRENAGETLQATDKQNLMHQFDQFHKDNLQSGSQKVVEQLNKTGDWLEELDHGYQDCVDTIQQENEAMQSKQIMLVDDDEFYRDTLTTMFQEAGIHVQAVGDGRAALMKLQHSKPGLILLDYKMPGIDGIATLKQIRMNPDTRSIPVIMLTGISAREIVDKSLRAGATDFIVKPGSRNTILSKIDRALKNNVSSDEKSRKI